MAPLAQRTYSLVLLIAGALLLASPAAAQQPSAQQPSATVQRLAEELRADQEAHLWRVALWGGLNVAGGLALWGTASRSTHPARWSFGGMSAGWGLVNVGIAAFGGLSLDPPAATAAAALSAERTYHDILLLNLGLNVGYMGVGGTMLAASARDVAAADEWRGAGYALLLQGAGLLALDGIAFVASRARLGELLGATTGHVSVHAVPTGVTLTVLF
jgi:hypothetical protein